LSGGRTAPITWRKIDPSESSRARARVVSKDIRRIGIVAINPSRGMLQPMRRELDRGDSSRFGILAIFRDKSSNRYDPSFSLAQVDESLCCAQCSLLPLGFLFSRSRCFLVDTRTRWHDSRAALNSTRVTYLRSCGGAASKSRRIFRAFTVIISPRLRSVRAPANTLLAWPSTIAPRP